MNNHIRAAKRPLSWPRAYLGDGVYVCFDREGLWLTAENGIEATDTIYLEPAVYKALTDFVQDQKGHKCTRVTRSQ